MTYTSDGSFKLKEQPLELNDIIRALNRLSYMDMLRFADIVEGDADKIAYAAENCVRKMNAGGGAAKDAPRGDIGVVGDLIPSGYE